MCSADPRHLEPRKSCPVCGGDFAADLIHCPIDEILLTYPDQLIGTVLDGRYEILSVVGQGGMSIVYKARQPGLERLVAIKLLKSHLSTDPVNLKRFQREAQAASFLQHPHILSVYSIGICKQGQPYLALEYLEGESLSHVLQTCKPLPILQALDITHQIGEAMEHAHARGIIHRDLKPSNIMLIKCAQTEQFVKVVDFGTAKLLPTLDKQMQQLTRTGELLGTLTYMSPEQKAGKKVDARSDIYSLGFILYEALSEDCKIPQAVKPLVMRALEENPEKRYQTASEFLRELERVKKSFLTGTATTAPAIVKTGSHPKAVQRNRSRETLLVAALSLALLLVLTWLAVAGANRETKLSWQLDLQTKLRMPTRD